MSLKSGAKASARAPERSSRSRTSWAWKRVLMATVSAPRRASARCKLEPLGPVGQPQRDAVAGAHPRGRQAAREAGGAIRELRGGDRAVVEDQRGTGPTGELPQQARQRLGLPPAHLAVFPGSACEHSHPLIERTSAPGGTV